MVAVGPSCYKYSLLPPERGGEGGLEVPGEGGAADDAEDGQRAQLLQRHEELHVTGQPVRQDITNKIPVADNVREGYPVRYEDTCNHFPLNKQKVVREHIKSQNHKFLKLSKNKLSKNQIVF